MPGGGKRRGAGRPKGAKGKAPLAREALRAYFDAQAVKVFAPVLIEYFKRAQGKKTNADPRILIDLLNRLLGKPPESVEVSGTGEGGSVRIVYRQLKE